MRAPLRSALALITVAGTWRWLSFHDLEPLVEVVRDTVGRHDTFGLACTAKYYEDMGYFGHVNCTENFNAQLDPFAIAPRKGWEALNFFYNTGFDDDHVLFLDEPTASLDPAATKAFEDLIGAIVARQIKVVMATHDLGEARRLAGDVVLLHQVHVNGDKYDGKTIDQLRGDLSAKTGENVVIRRFARFAVGE